MTIPFNPWDGQAHYSEEGTAFMGVCAGYRMYDTVRLRAPGVVVVPRSALILAASLGDVGGTHDDTTTLSIA